LRYGGQGTFVFGFTVSFAVYPLELETGTISAALSLFHAGILEIRKVSPTMDSEKKAHPILTQSLFHTAYVPSPTWRSYFTSTVFHSLAILALLMISVPAIREVQKHEDHVTLIAPQLPAYRPKILPRLQRPMETPKLVVKNEAKPKLEPLKPIEVKPITVPKREIAAAPEIKPTVTPAPTLPEIKNELPAPKPPIKTGVFQTTEQAKGQTVPKELKVGGFGDPQGVPPSQNSRTSQLAMAAVGSFDLPAGTGHEGGGGKGVSGGVRPTSFGSIADPSGVPGGTGRAGSVHTGAFGEAPVGRAAAPATKPKPAEPAFTPVEILSKPKPRYTEEARNLKLEGQVSLEVVFQANGSVRIVRIIHGLGHGLDEAAEEAAMQVRFRPATRGGVAVDSTATIHIIFQLT
jgi:TonB family protein